MVLYGSYRDNDEIIIRYAWKWDKHVLAMGSMAGGFFKPCDRFPQDFRKNAWSDGDLGTPQITNGDPPANNKWLKIPPFMRRNMIGRFSSHFERWGSWLSQVNKPSLATVTIIKTDHLVWVKQWHVYHPLVITVPIGGMFTIPSHGWFMTLFYPH